MTPQLDELAIDQQRALHDLCEKFEDRLLSDEPPTPQMWLGQRGELPAAVVLREILAIRSEYISLERQKATFNAAGGDTLSTWLGECLRLLPDDTDMVRSVFAEIERLPQAQANSVSSESLESNLTDKRYRFIEEIDRGGAGAVWRVYDQHLQRETAVKVLLNSGIDKSATQRLRQEARLCGRLSHPGIVPVYELDHFKDGSPFISMKLIRGETLSTRLKSTAKERSKPESTALLNIVLQVTQAIGYAHSCDVIHRDLKPANIMVDQFGEVQVMDWGLGKDLGRGPAENADQGKAPATDETAMEHHSLNLTVPETLSGAVFGTLAYMPPEQTQGDSSLIDKRSDVFALGSILCEVLTDKPPYLAESTQKLLKKASEASLEDAYRRLDTSGHRADLIQLAKECLSANPADRPQDASAIAARLRRMIPSPSIRKRNRLILGFALTTVAAAAVAIFFAARTTDTVESKAQVERINRVESLVQEADDHMAAERFGNALDAIRMARSIDDQPQLAVRESNLLLNLKRWHGLENTLIEALGIWPDDRDLHIARIDSFRATGRILGAHQYVMNDRTLRNDTNIKREMAHQLLLAEKYREALEYHDILRELPGDIEMEIAFIPALIKANRCKEALEIAENAFKAEPSNPDVIMARAKARIELANYQGAAADLKSWEKLVDESNRSKAGALILKQIPLYAPFVPELLAGEFTGLRRPNRANRGVMVALRAARHQYQRGDYAQSLNFYLQGLATDDSVALIARRQWVLDVICTDLLAGEVDGRTAETFDQVLALLEQQLAACLAPDKPKTFGKHIYWLYVLVHSEETRRLRESDAAAFGLSPKQKGKLDGFWSRCQKVLDERPKTHAGGEKLLRQRAFARKQQQFIQRRPQPAS